MTIAVSRKSDIISLIIGRGVPVEFSDVFPCTECHVEDIQFSRTKLEAVPETVLGGIWKSVCLLERPEENSGKEIRRVFKEFDPRSKQEIEYKKAEAEYVENARKARRLSFADDGWSELCHEIQDRINFGILHSLKMLGTDCCDEKSKWDTYEKLREDKRKELMTNIYLNKIPVIL